MASDRQRRAKQQRRRRPAGAGAADPDPVLAREDTGAAAAGDAPVDAGDGVSTPGAHPDAGLEDVVDVRGPDGTTPAPDPLKHGSAWIDEAKLAEAGADVPEPDGEDGRDVLDADGLPRTRRDDADVAGDVVMSDGAALDDPDAPFEVDAGPDDDVRPAEDDEDAVEAPVGRRGRRRPAAVAASSTAAGRPEGGREREVEREREAHPERRGALSRFIAFLGHCVDELRRVQWPDRRHTGQGTAVTLGFVVLAGAYLGLMDALWKPIVELII